jgi:hypothetical protein
MRPIRTVDHSRPASDADDNKRLPDGALACPGRCLVDGEKLASEGLHMTYGFRAFDRARIAGAIDLSRTGRRRSSDCNPRVLIGRGELPHEAGIVFVGGAGFFIHRAPGRDEAGHVPAAVASPLIAVP